MKNKLILKVAVFSLFIYILALASCGGGGGGAGGVSIPASEYTTHNPTGWAGGGSGGSGGNGSGVNVSGGTPIVVTNYVYNGNNYTKDQINELIQAMRDNPSQPEGVFTVQFYVTGDSDPRYARVTKTSNGVEKFEHQYKATCNNGSNTEVRSFYKDSGLNISDLTTSNMAGWRCSQNAVLYGSVITGMQGDITLTAEFVSFSTSRQNNKTQLVATSDISVVDSETITITGGSGTFSVTGDSYLNVTQVSSNPAQYTVSIKINGTAFIGFNDNATGTITITDTGVTPNETQTVSFALKNMYTYQLKDASGAEVGSPVQKNAGETLDFNTAKSAITGVPTGREVVAFKNDAGNVVLCGNTSPGPTSLTFNSMTFTSRFINLQAVLDFTMTTKNAASTVWNATETYSYGGDSGPLYTLEKFSTTNKELHVTITDCSANSNLSVTKAGDSQNFLEIAQTSLTTAGTFVVKLTNNVTHDSIGADYIYPITVTDSGTGTSKVIFVKIAQPPAYKYSLKYTKADGTLASIGTANQNVVFTPGSQITFGDQSAPLTMGKLDSSLTGVEAAIQITGWTGTGPYGNGLSYGIFPNPGPADCTSDGSGGYHIELIATTSPDIGVFYSNCRTSSNAVVAGDVVLSNGLCVDKTYYANNSSTLSSYVVGTVCTRGAGNDQKFVLAKSPSSNTNLKWSDVNVNVGGLQVTINGTDLNIGVVPTYDLEEAGLSFSPDSSGKNSLSILESAGQDVNDYPAFKYCKNYKPTGITTGNYASDWYLPSVAEVYAIHQQLSTFPSGFIDTQIWLTTSSQYNQTQFWYTQGSSVTPGLGNICTIGKQYTSNDYEVYPCHELNFTAPPSP